MAAMGTLKDGDRVYLREGDHWSVGTWEDGELWFKLVPHDSSQILTRTLKRLGFVDA